MKKNQGGRKAGRRDGLILLLVSILAMVGLARSFAAKPPSDQGDQVATGGDLVFMNDAATGGMSEVELGRLAMKQAARDDVKAAIASEPGLKTQEKE